MNLDLFPLTGARLVPVNLIQPGQYQPRKRFDPQAMEEMAASIRQHGVMQPILVRPLASGDRFEIVAGERRWRGTKAAPLDDIPAVVRDLSLMQVLELQAIENTQREDLHPLEEAYSFDLLMHPPDGSEGYSVAKIAEKVGKDASHISRRLVLCRLIPQACEAFLAGHLVLQTAGAIARHPVGIQEKAFQQIMATRSGEDKVVAHRDAMKILQGAFMLRLAQAPFPIKDATLLPAAGGCNVCPKRTGANPDLFTDVQEADTCTDPDCHGLKVVAWNERRKAEAREKGIAVIDGKKASALLKFGPDSAQLNADYVYMDEPLEELTGNKSSLHKLLGTLLKPSALYEHPRDHTLREIVHTHKATQVLKDHGLLVKRPSKGEQAALVAPPAPAKGKGKADADERARLAEAERERQEAADIKRKKAELVTQTAELGWRTQLFRAMHKAMHDCGYNPSLSLFRAAVVELGMGFCDHAEHWELLCELWRWQPGEDFQDNDSAMKRLTDVTDQMNFEQLGILAAEFAMLIDLEGRFTADVPPPVMLEALDEQDEDGERVDELTHIDWRAIRAELGPDKAKKAAAKKASRAVQSPPNPSNLPAPAGGTKGAATKGVASKPATQKTKDKGQAPSAQTRNEGSDLPHWVGQMVKVRGAKAIGEVTELNADGSLLVAFPSGKEGQGTAKRSVLRADVTVLPGQPRPASPGDYVRVIATGKTAVVRDRLASGIEIELKTQLGPASAWPFPDSIQVVQDSEIELLPAGEDA